MRSTAIACALLLGGCVSDDQPLEPLGAAMRVCDARQDAGLVSLDDAGRFVADGEPWVPQGVCSYPLLEHAGNLRMAEVRDVFAQAQALGRTVVRTNAFFDGGGNRARLRNDDGSMNEAGLVGLDRLLDAARAARVKLVLVLSNYWTDYGGIEAVQRRTARPTALSSPPRAAAAHLRPQAARS